ncbi:hypothetical protein [Methylibium sp.]|uniref:hypothetical protein n=1 Tax=Methylibium sp. TaxID=2067992 RepID=UPI00180DC032|nr:hypothetical protein [Methylibium sp.]MBA3590579.1 hypothetical protein [Methylibium sp.]
MPDSGKSSGPGSPLKERKDAAKEREGRDQLEPQLPDADGGVDGEGTSPGRSTTRARHAERDAHTPNDPD